MPTYPTYKLGEIIDKVPIEFKVKQKEYLPKGKFPVVDQGQPLIGGYTDDETLLVKTELPVIVFGDHTKVKKFVDFPFVAGADGTKIIKPKKDYFIEPKLFYWFLHCVKFPDKGYARHFQYLLKSDIAVPPLPTQHAIVSRIETLFAELDKAVQHLRTAQQQLKTYRQAVLNHWLNNEDGRWETVKLGEVAEKIFDGPFGTHLKSDDYVSSGIRVVRLENIKAGYFDDSKQSYVTPEKYEIIKRHTVYPTDLIMSTFISEKVKVCQMPKHIEFAVNKADCIGIRLKPLANNDFIKYYLSLRSVYHQLEIQVHGATRPRVNTTQIKNIEINLPPLAEQQRIVAEIESRLSQASTSSAYIENALQQAEALRQSILKKAFSGELVVSTSSTTSKGG